MPARSQAFDPLAILGALERNYVSYVLIGGLAHVLRGADLITTGVDICPSFAKRNLEHLRKAIAELGAAGGRDDRGVVLDQQTLGGAPFVAVTTGAGELKVIGSPAGVPNGFVELRRAASREDLGHAIRPLVASAGDLAAMAAALGREQDLERLPALRQIVELEVHRRAPGRVVAPAASARRPAARRGPRLTP